MSMMRNGVLSLALSVLCGCPGTLEQSAWLSDAGRAQALGNEPTTPYAPPTTTADAGNTPPPVVAADAGQVTPPIGKADAGTTPPKDGGTTSPPPAPDAGNTAPAVVCSEADAAKILTPKCGACHGVNAPAAGIDLVTAGIKARLVNVAARGCSGRTLVTVSGKTVTGHFFDKLLGGVQNCGGQMPFGMAPLDLQETECLKRWIAP